MLGLIERKDKLDIKQLIEISNTESNDRDLEIIDREKMLTEEKEEHMGYLINEKARMQILTNDIERKQLYLQELKRGNRIDELRGLEDEKKRLQTEIDKICADYSLHKIHKNEATAAMNAIINQMGEEENNKLKFEIAKSYCTYHKSKRELETLIKEKDEIMSRLVFENEEEKRFLGLEQKKNKLNDKIKLSELDLKAAERESIEAAALLDRNERDKRKLIEENEEISKKIKASFSNEYPEDTDLLERYQCVKQRVKDLKRDLSSASFAKNEFLEGILEASKETCKCFLCDKDFEEAQLKERKEFFDCTLKQPTEEELRSMKELEEFEAEYLVLKKFKPDINKAHHNAERIISIDKESDQMFSDAGRKQLKISQASDALKRLKKEELEVKDLQQLIFKTDELEKIIRDIDTRKFASYQDEELYNLYQKGQKGPENLTASLQDKQRSLSVVEHNLSTLDAKLSDLNRSSRDINGKIQKIRDERKNEKSVDEIDHDIEISTLDLEAKREQLEVKEKSFNEEMSKKDAALKSLKSVLTRLNYLLPDLEKRHSNLMKLNTSNCDETIMMTNYRRYKEVEKCLDACKDELEVYRKQQEKLMKETKLVADKILLKTTEDEIRENENKVLIQIETIKLLTSEFEKEKKIKDELTKVSAMVSNLEGKDETHKKTAQEYYDKIYKNRDKEMQYFERLTHYEYYRMLVEDLDLYMQSLEEALVKYHKEKIELINKNIAELWKMTYQNGDIKRIEIKAEQIIDQNMESKGNFNYRVVFYNKDENCMEMRGRSSMGQKVLASIVIRIALAEAFGINCGVTLFNLDLSSG